MPGAAAPRGMVSPSANDCGLGVAGEGDLGVAEDPHRLHHRLGVARDAAAVLDLHHDVEGAVVAELHVADVAHLHAGEPHGLPHAQVGAPAELRVDRVALPEPAAHEPDGAGDADDEGDREEEPDGDLVASFHAVM
jgi:hypothetical protein